MANCAFCDSEYSDERLDAGYEYCMDDACVNKGMKNWSEKFRQEYTFALLHKCNYFWVKKDELHHLNVRNDITLGWDHN